MRRSGVLFARTMEDCVEFRGGERVLLCGKAVGCNFGVLPGPRQLFTDDRNIKTLLRNVHPELGANDDHYALNGNGTLVVLWR